MRVLHGYGAFLSAGIWGRRSGDPFGLVPSCSTRLYFKRLAHFATVLRPSNAGMPETLLYTHSMLPLMES